MRCCCLLLLFWAAGRYLAVEPTYYECLYKRSQKVELESRKYCTVSTSSTKMMAPNLAKFVFCIIPTWISGSDQCVRDAPAVSILQTLVLKLSTWQKRRNQYVVTTSFSQKNDHLPGSIQSGTSTRSPLCCRWACPSLLRVHIGTAHCYNIGLMS